MPFKSKAQQKFLFATNPKVAKEMAGKTPKSAYKNMPEHIKKKGKMGTMLAALKRMGS